MSVALQQNDEDLRPEQRRLRRVRATLAIAVIAALAAQSLMALATPKPARASTRPADATPWYRGTQPGSHTPVGMPKGKDPRTC